MTTHDLAMVLMLPKNARRWPGPWRYAPKRIPNPVMDNLSLLKSLRKVHYLTQPFSWSFETMLIYGIENLLISVSERIIDTVKRALRRYAS